ncbi:MAG: oxygen-dependent protoporphyrinogen oxidase [Gammaproteobacteria bacterium]|jgi:oxygen-dependent protoporphyrinogen oxidase
MKVIVVGAGIAGLGAAIYFQKKGHDVLVLESSDRVGGRAISHHRAGTSDIVDTGTQYYHSSYHRALRLINESGLNSQLKKVKGHTRIYDNHLSKGSFLYNRKLPWYRSTGIFGNLQLGYFLAETILKYKLDPFVLDARARLDSKNAVESNHNSLIYQSIMRPLAQVGSLSEPDEMDLSLHHLHRLIHIVLFTDYLSLSSGTVSLHEAMASRLQIKFETPVIGLIEESKKICGVVLENERLSADHVVIATTAPVAATLIPKEWTEDYEFLLNIKVPSFSLPTFFLDRPLEKNVWSYLLHQHNRKISYLTDAAQKNPNMVPSGKSIIQPWICYPHSTELEKYSDDEVISLCVDEIEEIFPKFSTWIEDIHLTRHPYGVPFHSTGHVQKAVNFMRNMDVKKVSFCGDYLSGGYMESALWSAERAANVFG